MKNKEKRETLLSKQIQNLSNACFDIQHHGKPEDAFGLSQRYAEYSRFAEQPGTFRASVDLDDLLGSHIDATSFRGNIFTIGHVIYKDESGNEKSSECYIHSSGVVTKIFKNDGDEVHPNERILMINPD